MISGYDADYVKLYCPVHHSSSPVVQSSSPVQTLVHSTKFTLPLKAYSEVHVLCGSCAVSDSGGEMVSRATIIVLVMLTM